MESGKLSSGNYITALLSHDISNYNQTTRGYLEMLLAEQMGNLSPDQTRVLTICLRQTSRIQSIIDSVRLVVELGQRPPHFSRQHLDNAIRQAVISVQNEYADREVRVNFVPAERYVMAEDQLPVVFRHLVSNTVRHNDAEVVEVDIEVSEVPGETPVWRVLVGDNGPGIPENRQQTLFSRLATQEVHGSGFGLALVEALVSRWNGRVWIDQFDRNPGAVVGLELPQAPPRK